MRRQRGAPRRRPNPEPNPKPKPKPNPNPNPSPNPYPNPSPSPNPKPSPNQEHYGVALFVNEWNTNSGQLYLSWGNALSGCEELSTPPNSLPPDTWAYVTAVLGGGAARLYINGVLSADT